MAVPPECADENQNKQRRVENRPKMRRRSSCY